MATTQASNGNQPPSQTAVGRMAGKRDRTQQQMTLDIRTRDGRALGLPYSYMMAFELVYPADEDLELTLYFTTHKVIVNGTQLLDLYDLLKTHRLEGIYESDSSFDGGGDDPHIAKIKIEEVG